jgi:hypothetical protein
MSNACSISRTDPTSHLEMSNACHRRLMRPREPSLDDKRDSKHRFGVPMVRNQFGGHPCLTAALSGAEEFQNGKDAAVLVR